MAIPRKIGFFSIKLHARAMCKYILLFTPAIQRAFPTNAALLAALSAANAACEVLMMEIGAQETAGI